MSDFFIKFKKKHTQRRVRTQALNPGHIGSKGALKAGKIVFSIEEPPVGYPIPNGHPRKKYKYCYMSLEDCVYIFIYREREEKRGKGKEKTTNNVTIISKIGKLF